MSNMAVFWYFFDFMLSRCVAKVFPKWSWDGSSCPCYYWYRFCFYIIIIIIADNITAIPLLELCSTGHSEVTINGLNHEWATFLLENLLLMDVTSIRVGKKGWEVKNALYVLLFVSQFHRLQTPLLHQAHPTACFCLPLQRKLGLYKIPFPWHDGPSSHAQRILPQQHRPVTTENNLCEF